MTSTAEIPMGLIGVILLGGTFRTSTVFDIGTQGSGDLGMFLVGISPLSANPRIRASGTLLRDFPASPRHPPRRCRSVIGRTLRETDAAAADGLPDSRSCREILLGRAVKALAKDAQGWPRIEAATRACRIARTERASGGSAPTRRGWPGVVVSSAFRFRYGRFWGQAKLIFVA